jgi:O-antigen/teichoic acid export membrane protein
MVQYSRISNTKDKKYAKNITIKFIKFSTSLTIFLIVILLLLPDKVFACVFSKDFSGLRIVIMSLAPGIIVMSGSLMLSHYFSGIGQHWRNTIGSSIGLAITVILGFILIPRYDVVGAGLTASASYFSSACYLWIVFSKHTQTRLRDLLMTKSDIEFAVNELKTMFREAKF